MHHTIHSIAQNYLLGFVSICHYRHLLMVVLKNTLLNAHNQPAAYFLDFLALPPAFLAFLGALAFLGFGALAFFGAFFTLFTAAFLAALGLDALAGMLVAVTNVEDVAYNPAPS